MDTDFHPIVNEHGELQNPQKPIHIGNNVWIGCRATILKGVSIADNSVIASNSTIRKNCEKASCLYGDGAKLLKESIFGERNENFSNGSKWLYWPSCCKTVVGLGPKSDSM